ncbi:HigA family addiction module antitoxin [Stappia indica]|jgi:addiction module HigA family antidote|uniref:HigA family addiction module antidote protein n=1 Tax=Stappia indica TaxID=538381 RepID=A0A857C2R5_9HYPH|nr:HigA family addiction module antitoxin [Stappia indica]QGZ33141.1 HigA family addiction module antidote protein [Stappia indica]
MLAPVHPGEILREEFLSEYGLSPYALAKALGVPRTRLERIVREETPVTIDTAMRLSRFFGTSAEFWLNLQTQFDLQTARETLADEIEQIRPLETA